VFLRRPVPAGRRVAATILRNALTHGDSDIYVKDFLRLKFIIQLVSFSANNRLYRGTAQGTGGSSYRKRDRILSGRILMRFHRKLKKQKRSPTSDMSLSPMTESVAMSLSESDSFK